MTGDIGHHEGIDAVARGLNIIDGGHYGVEQIFVRDMGSYLRGHMSGVDVIEAPVSHPFTVISGKLYRGSHDKGGSEYGTEKNGQ